MYILVLTVLGFRGNLKFFPLFKVTIVALVVTLSIFKGSFFGK